MQVAYTIAIYLYSISIRLAALFNTKAKKWVTGRQSWEKSLQKTNLTGCIWMHCASLGEFEQGRPLLESLGKTYPDNPILLTFFSPSGYEVRKNYALANVVSYLPLDTKSNARKFLALAKPNLALFVKYEVWHNFFAVCQDCRVPLVLFSAKFSRKQIYFRSWGRWFLDSLKIPAQIFTQDEKSAELLRVAGLTNFSVAGDTRFDRVIEIRRKAERLPRLEKFIGESKPIVAGSTWPADEDILLRFLTEHPKVTLILAPHEIHEERIAYILKKVPQAQRWSDDAPRKNASRLLIVDVIGILNVIYQYGIFSYVGGGFGAGIHNTLEAAVYGQPLLFGPEYKRFEEARQLVNLGSAQSISDYKEFDLAATELLQNDASRRQKGIRAESLFVTMPVQQRY